MLFVLISADMQLNYNKFEIGGALSVNTFNGSTSALFMENAGFNFTPWLNFSFSGEQQFRNKTFLGSNYIGSEYRHNISGFQIPAGMIFGFKALHIGSFYQFVPVLGITSGLYYSLSPQVQLRAVYRGKIYFDMVRVCGNDFLFGFSFSFVTRASEPNRK